MAATIAILGATCQMAIRPVTAPTWRKVRSPRSTPTTNLARSPAYELSGARLVGAQIGLVGGGGGCVRDSSPVGICGQGTGAGLVRAGLWARWRLEQVGLQISGLPGPDPAAGDRRPAPLHLIASRNSEAQRQQVLADNVADDADLDVSFAEWTESETGLGVFHGLCQASVRPGPRR